MTPLTTSRRHVALLLAVAASFALGACGDAEPDLVMLGELPLGEVWEGSEEKLYSTGNEELIVRDFFGDREGGVFLDVGSADPIQGSTTYYLEKHLRWSGLAVDALSEYAPAYRKKRPETRFSAYIVTDASGAKQKFYRVKHARELSSTDADRKWDGRKVRAEEIEVPTITLDALLEQQGIAKLDFVSVDIEGGEAKALAGFDIRRFRPELVCIEIAKDNVRAVERYFAEAGYRRIEKYRRFDYANDYYTPAASDGGTGGS